MKATSVKEVLTAMLWIYQNKLEHTIRALYRDDKGNFYHKVNKNNVANVKSCCLAGCVELVKADRPILYDTYRAIQGHVGASSTTEWNDDPANKVNKKKCIKVIKEIIKTL